MACFTESFHMGRAPGSWMFHVKHPFLHEGTLASESRRAREETAAAGRKMRGLWLLFQAEVSVS